MSQLALPLRLDDHAVFSSFHPAGNEGLVAHLRAIASGQSTAGCWLWGAPATGKTHLLQAVCAETGDRAAFVPTEALLEAGPAMIDGLATREVVCLDDVHAIAGRPDWERALFLLYNDLQGRGGQLVVAAAMTPRACPFELADLASRMSQLPAYRLRALDDAERAAALRLRAAHRGLDLPDGTARYLLGRSPRDMASLYRLLDTLDREALRAQRRLTIPFVRRVLAP